jgi:hypothetical protein
MKDIVASGKAEFFLSKRRRKKGMLLLLLATNGQQTGKLSVKSASLPSFLLHWLPW